MAVMADHAPADGSIPASEWDYCTIGELVSALQRRKISAAELTQHTITRVEALDTRLNAIVVRDFERAREAARAADAALDRGERRPLLGVPVTVKEAYNVAGLPTTWGYPECANYVPEHDALVVSRLKSAGAIVLGKTNVPEGLGDFQSYNDIYGTTNNPWDVSRTPGGSSGGSAAALAAGFGPLSMGSDIGGSLRMPAHFCGLYAHKPTLGVVPMRGYNQPPAPPQPGHGDLAVLGPMTRAAADLELALDVVADPDGEQEGIGYRLSLPAPRHDKLSDFRAVVVDTHPLMPTSDAVRTAMHRLTERLAHAGVAVTGPSSALPDLAASARIYMQLLAAATSNRMTPEAFEQVRATAAALSIDDHSLNAERHRGTAMSHREWLQVDAVRKGVAQQWRRFFRDCDVVIYPSAAIPAFPHDHSAPIEDRRLDIDGRAYPYLDACYIWADPAGTCGLPATAAPIDHSTTGLPIGVQIIGPFLEDRTTIAFAALIEREFGGFAAPPGYR
jgi:amidase